MPFLLYLRISSTAFSHPVTQWFWVFISFLTPSCKRTFRSWVTFLHKHKAQKLLLQLTITFLSRCKKQGSVVFRKKLKNPQTIPRFQNYNSCQLCSGTDFTRDSLKLLLLSSCLVPSWALSLESGMILRQISLTDALRSQQGQAVEPSAMFL